MAMSLTEDERNLLVGGGVVTAVALTAAGVLATLPRGSEEKPAQHSLSIEATRGGTTSPSPGFYKYVEPEIMEVKAVTFEGYEFKGWYLNGEFAGVDATLPLTVTGQNLLIASFEEVGAPPLIPAYIKPLQSCRPELWFGIRRETVYGELGIPLYDVLHLEPVVFLRGFVKFKICDAGGNGVANQKVAVYSDPMPDVTEYGVVMLNNHVHAADDPLILTSDGDGVVSAAVNYVWMEYGNLKGTIGKAGRAHYSAWWTSGDVTPIYDGLQSPTYTSFTGFTRLLNPVFRAMNYLHAVWVDNPNLQVLGDAYADCLVRIEDSKEF